MKLNVSDKDKKLFMKRMQNFWNDMSKVVREYNDLPVYLIIGELECMTHTMKSQTDERNEKLNGKVLSEENLKYIG